MDRRIQEVVRILPKLIFSAQHGNPGVTDDNGKRERDRKLLEAVAKAVNLSPLYLSRLFGANMKITLKQYADKLRMEKAMELAENSYLTVYQIADEVRAGDERNFRRRLKKTHGLTLSQLRKRCDEQNETRRSERKDGDKNSP